MRSASRGILTSIAVGISRTNTDNNTGIVGRRDGCVKWGVFCSCQAHGDHHRGVWLSFFLFHDPFDTLDAISHATATIVGEHLHSDNGDTFRNTVCCSPNGSSDVSTVAVAVGGTAHVVWITCSAVIGTPSWDTSVTEFVVSATNSSISHKHLHACARVRVVVELLITITVDAIDTPCCLGLDFRDLGSEGGRDFVELAGILCTNCKKLGEGRFDDQPFKNVAEFVDAFDAGVVAFLDVMARLFSGGSVFGWDNPLSDCVVINRFRIK